jgi:hypothetical protein
MIFGLPTASRGCVREKRRTRAVVDNPQPVEIPLKKPFRTVLTSGATSLKRLSPGHANRGKEKETNRGK